MPDLSLVTFEADLEKFAEIVGLKQREITQKIAADLWARIIGNFDSHRHPVDTGRARAAWGLSIGNPAPPTPPPETTVKGFYGPPTTPAFEAIEGDQIVYILNALPYIEALEDGHSKQAPSGFVRLSILEVEAEIDAIIALNS